MLNEPAHPAWQDPKIDHCFVKLLGDMKESCMAIINMISESLQSIEKEGGRLASVVDPKVGRPYPSLGFLRWKCLCPEEKWHGILVSLSC